MKQQENRAVIAWRGAASAELVSSADRAYMKTLVSCPTPDFGTECPELVDTLTKKQTDFSIEIEMGGEATKWLPRLDYPLVKTGRLSTAAHENVPFILTVDWLGCLCFKSGHVELRLQVIYKTTDMKSVTYRMVYLNS